MRTGQGRWPAGLPALLLALPVAAFADAPEIQRPAATAQAVGALHTVRQIPEACVRIEGRFTGQAEAPYAMRLVTTDARCQPRAGMLEAAEVRPGEDGWRLNDRIVIPAAGCPGQEAVVEVWRRPVEQALARDGQGQVRLYLGDLREQAAAAGLPARPAYAARMQVEGQACG
ncbi:hypothetical protein [Stenotrophomonas mori]|uniref:Secreted protein n=1 Tax=Stenotrophomonas mori TaxID=2871096 RepID=A0ABT0SJ87_9GAMM|nr:hypothetical protein [Stenotrophomonas mori]MCL7715168.1 hypothetical protein [Stenotrophomonas mori]